MASVNDLLVPDAKQGMFVTAFYAVLSPDSGQLVYANAGHNPPLLCRAKDTTTELLSKGGIALGVIEGDHFRDRTIALEPGDTVVFYTDGITEAMSPTGDLFGEDRLLETVRSQGTCAANIMLSAIEESVVAHRSTAPTSDDITLLVLQRLQQIATPTPKG
jgi:sigma-B regulation protein RsbU (phosphoserine phosphatase)